ncbi:MAG: DUF4838 domain-containing protein [Verrucomicrobiota bacterium]
MDLLRCVLLSLAGLLPAFCFAETFIVENGESNAEIIIADDPPRGTHLAARDLQVYVEKITGAQLKITAEPTGKAVKIYVGESEYTQELGIETDALKYGAYRIVSGDDWLVLIGQDSNFTPIEPWPKSNADIASGRMQAEWDKITGAQWGYTHSQLHKHYSGRNHLFGTADETKTDEDGNVHVWTYDERGSFNAVCGFLRDLGVRWYMPGDIGEILPETKSIALPKVDKTVHPDFPMRILNFRPAVYGRDAMMWGFRLGVRQPYGRQAAHGMAKMTDNERTLKNHPEWFALYGGKRQNDPQIKNNQLCYGNEELLRETVRFCQVQFDHFDMDVVSVQPPDGYTAICQCPLCAGKDSPELGYRGMLSNYIWDFVNRVAKEVGKTHPDKKISNLAYGIYTEPPTNIDKLEPNIQVIIVGGRRPLNEDREDLRQLRAGWARKTDTPVEIFENYPFTGRGFYLPAYFPRKLGEEINETKDQTRGEDIWITMDFKENAIGYNHFLLYFTARMYWGGKEQDAGAMFDEYVEKFYGPAAAEMGAFFAYCEDHWRVMDKDGAKAEEALRLFAIAKDKVASDSIHGDRIALIDNYLNGLRRKATQLKQKRGPVPQLRVVSTGKKKPPIVIDGKLDDYAWENIPTASKGGLRELQTGRLATYGTQFMVEWIGNELCFAIRCEEAPGESLNIATEKNGDQAIWYGDCVEIQIATDAHSYYQLAINPAGALVDLDRGASRNQWFNWSSKAEVATSIADDHWIVEVKLPITKDENDPLNQVVGSKPTPSLPWFVNVCRQRARDNGTELSAFSPTGSGGFHEPMKFAHFHAGNSTKFPADESVTDHIIAGRAAHALTTARKWEEALAAYLKMAETEKVTDFQKSEALAQAARCSGVLKEFERAEELIAKIPIESVAKTARMHHLIAQRKWQEVATEFADEDLSQWPFWQIGEAAFTRGRAFYFARNGERTEDDLQLALKYEPDTRTQVSIRQMIGHNRETNLGDNDGALEFYRANFDGKTGIGGADEFRSVDRAAQVLSRQGNHDEALALFDAVDFEKTKGFWLHEMLISKANALAAAGNKEDARALLVSVFEDSSANDSHRKKAAELLEN